MILRYYFVKMNFPVLLFVVVCLLSVGVFGGVEHGCRHVHDFFRARNIQSDFGGQGPTCKGKCCSPKTEFELKIRVRKDFSGMVSHSSSALQGLFSTTANTIHDHVMELSKYSQDKTNAIFVKLYKKMSLHAKSSTENFYNDIREYVNTNRTDIGSPPTIDIDKSTIEFFKNIFPLVYRDAIKLQNQDFTEDYKMCLKDAFQEILPFSEIPNETANQLRKSLETTRVLLQALAMGSEVLNATDVLLAGEFSQTSCHNALLNMTYCSKCHGLEMRIKPCTGYCLNVMRGCLTNNVAQLDSPLNSYVDGIERLVTGERSDEGRIENTDFVLRQLENKISEGIMYALTAPENLEKTVKKVCGNARTMEIPNLPEISSIRSELARVTPPDTQLLQFIASMSQYKGFYANMADTMCQDEGFAEQDDNAECWNGVTVGKYTKTVVGVDASSQKYNQEVDVSSNSETNWVSLSRLADKLRHVRQMLMARVSQSYPSETIGFMQRDEAGGGEGSGSGGRYGSDDEEIYDGEGSGSGDGRIDTSEESRNSKPKIETPSSKPTSSAPSMISRSNVTLITVSLLLLLRRWTA